MRDRTAPSTNNAPKNMPFELKPIESESLFIECFEHGVSGLGEWSEMVDGMLSAVRIFFPPEFNIRHADRHHHHLQETPPPHVPLVKKFIFGAAGKISTLSAVHMYESRENMEAVKALFSPDGEFGKMFATNPVITTEPTSNTLDVRLIVNPDGGDEEGKVLGIYAHGVPDFEEWLKLFGESQSDEFLKDFGIVKSYAGNMTDDSSWKKADVIMPMVIHVFKDYNSKAKFDTIFDPTFGMFKDIANAGGVLPPFFEQQLGSVPGKGEGAWIMRPATQAA